MQIYYNDYYQYSHYTKKEMVDSMKEFTITCFNVSFYLNESNELLYTERFKPVNLFFKIGG